MAKELAKLFVTLGLDDKEFGKKLDSIQKQMGQAGKIMTGMGVAITAALGLSVKAAEEERINIARLDSMLQNVGVSYDNVAGSLEKVIAATQRKTGIADNEQRDVLGELVFAIGDYQKALEVLPTALDLMAAKQMDAKVAGELLGKVAQGEFGTLSRYGIILKEGATAAEALAAVQEKVVGTAERMASTTNILKSGFGDLVEKIGSKLLPVYSGIVDKVMPIIEGIGKWIDENPKLAETLLIIAAAIGGLMTVIGPLLIALPAIAAGFTVLLGPVGLVIAAVAAVAAGAALLIMNWDKVTAFFERLWEGIKNAFSKAWEWLKENWTYFLGLPGLIIKHWDSILDFFKSIPKKIGDAFAAVKDFILAPFRAAWDGIEKGLNWLIDMLNKISFDIPDWIPGIGGKHFGIDIPPVSLPSFKGFEGIVPGPAGQPYPAIVHGGEYIGQTGGAFDMDAIRRAIRDGLAGMTVNVNVGGEDVAAVISRKQYRVGKDRI